LRCAGLAQDDTGCALSIGEYEIAVFHFARHKVTFAYAADTVGAFHIHMHAVFNQHIACGFVRWYVQTAPIAQRNRVERLRSTYK
jgi:hypothetical protein